MIFSLIVHQKSFRWPKFSKFPWVSQIRKIIKNDILKYPPFMSDFPYSHRLTAPLVWSQFETNQAVLKRLPYGCLALIEVVGREKKLPKILSNFFFKTW